MTNDTASGNLKKYLDTSKFPSLLAQELPAAVNYYPVCPI
jgi:hypothetical protein